jgi:hypothetical protein
MALVKFGGGITEMRGSIAGNTFSRNRYGAIVRAKTTPVNPNTPGQVAVRATMAVLTDRWSQTLTAAQRTAWNLYGSSVVMTNKLAESINLSGFNHYIRSCLEFRRILGGNTDAGPTVFEIPDADPTFAVTGTAAAQTLSITFDNGLDWADEDGAVLFVYQGSPQNPQRNFFGGPWRALGNVLGVNGAPPASPAVMPVVFAIAEGQRQWVYARIRRVDGRLSAPFRADAFVAA